MKYKFAILFTLLITISLLSGCGVKPSKLSAPDNVIEDTYPKTYPDISTDPEE